MNLKEMLEKHNINDFYYAEVGMAPASYEKFCVEIGNNLVFRPIEKRIYRTLLLKIGESYVDIKHPEREISLERDSEKISYVICWKHELGDYVADTNWNMPDFMNILEARLWFMFHGNYLSDVSERGITSEEPKEDREYSRERIIKKR